MTTRLKVIRAAVFFAWAITFFAIPLLRPAPDYTPIDWLTLVSAMALGGLIVFSAMMPEKP